MLVCVCSMNINSDVKIYTTHTTHTPVIISYQKPHVSYANTKLHTSLHTQKTQHAHAHG